MSCLAKQDFDKSGQDMRFMSFALAGEPPPYVPTVKYTVSVESNRKVEHRQIEISAKEHRRVVFEWQS